MSKEPLTKEDLSSRRREEAFRMSDATRRILEVSTELHLTWEEFEDVLERVKRRAYICIAPAELNNAPQNSAS